MTFRDVLTKMHLSHRRSRNQPDTGNIFRRIKLSKEEPASILAVRIPCNQTHANPISLTAIPFMSRYISMDHPANKTKNGWTLRQEQIVGRLPNLQKYEHERTFSWADRLASTVPYEGAHYMLYMCMGEATGLLENETLNKCPDRGTLTAYGDAFVFNIKRANRKTNFLPILINMDKDFLEDGKIELPGLSLLGREKLNELVKDLSHNYRS